jgi:hypothetical protein
MILESFLQGMRCVPLRQAFYGPNLGPIRLNGEHQTAAHSTTINEYGARSTDTVFATKVGSGKEEFVAYEVRQG